MRMHSVSLSALAFPIVLALAGCTAEAVPPTNVVAHTAVRAGMPREVQLSGTLAPDRQTDVAARISGRVLSILAEEGDRVRQGDILVRLDPTMESAVLGGLGSTIKQARINLDTVIALYDERIRSAESTLAQLRTAATATVRAAEVREETGGSGEDRQAKETLTNAAITLEAAADGVDRLFLLSQKYTDISRRRLIERHIGVRDPSSFDTVAQAYGTLRAQADGFRAYHDTRLLTGAVATPALEEGLRLAEAALRQATQTMERVHAVLQQSVTSSEFTEDALAAEEQRMMGHAAGAESLLRAVRALQQRDVSQQQTAVREQTQAQAQLEIEQAVRGLEVLRREKDAKIAEAQATITRLQAEAGISAAQLEQTVLRAPFDGVVVARVIDPGAVVGPGTPLLTVADDRSFELRMSIPDAALASLATGRSATVTVDTLPDAVFPGTVLRIAPSADARAKKIDVDLRVENPGGALKSGMFARVQFPLASSSGVILPAGAVLSRYGRDLVFVLEQDRAVERFVTIDARTDAAVAIAEGITEGEIVLTEGHHYLRDNDPVTVIADESAIGEASPLPDASDA